MERTQFLSLPVRWLLRRPGYLHRQLEVGSPGRILKKAGLTGYAAMAMLFVFGALIFGCAFYGAIMIHPVLAIILIPVGVWAGAGVTCKFHRLAGTGKASKDLIGWLRERGETGDSLPGLQLQAEIAWLAIDGYGKSLISSQVMLGRTPVAEGCGGKAVNKRF